MTGCYYSVIKQGAHTFSKAWLIKDVELHGFRTMDSEEDLAIERITESSFKTRW